jgi:hypothetical protein
MTSPSPINAPEHVPQLLAKTPQVLVGTRSCVIIHGEGLIDLLPRLRYGAVVQTDNTISGAKGYADLLTFMRTPENGFHSLTLPYTNGFKMGVYLPTAQLLMRPQRKTVLLDPNYTSLHSYALIL